MSAVEDSPAESLQECLDYWLDGANAEIAKVEPFSDAWWFWSGAHAAHALAAGRCRQGVQP